MNKSLLATVKKQAAEYYGKELNIVQTYADPKVSDCWVVRVEDKGGNWCFVFNTSFGKTLDDWMLEDGIDLEPGQKITSKLFGSPRFF
jgi:hypothetical protein